MNVGMNKNANENRGSRECRKEEEILIDILRKRNAEVRRKEILEECREGLAEYRSGVLKSQTAEAAIMDLRSYLNDAEVV